ncbi:MAG: paraquat-inducible protein A [Gammaproteobacteria bacterium]|nr:paraquat-inducible protein A [Gammaproteobacteria bacterium]
MLIGIISTLLLSAAAVSTYRLIVELRTLQSLQAQRAELMHVKYGLFNAEVWVDQVSLILAERVEQFELNETNRPQIKRNIEVVLDRLLQEIEQVLSRRNAEGSGWLDRLQGSLRQGVQDWLVDFDRLRARVPLYADAVLDELDRPQTRAEIQRSLTQALERAAGATFSHIDRTPIEQIVEAHGCPQAEACAGELASKADDRRRQAQIAALVTLVCIALLFLINLPAWHATPAAQSGTKTRAQTIARTVGQAAAKPDVRPITMAPETLALLTAATLVLLGAGVMTPMIEIEARIDQLSLTLLGEPVTFTDQVLYFQSKSILDVVQVLAATGAADMLLVAVLVVLFSLIFPAAKVLAGVAYYGDFGNARGLGLVRFFALRSGKWSMADVLVVAIFMAYIGFDGLIASQLAELGGASGERVTLLSTNGTQLQLGFFLFLAFVLASLVLSSLLEARAPTPRSKR